MKNISLTIFFLIFFSAALWSKTQKIILTGSEFTGSHIFAKELSRLINLSKKKRDWELVSRVEISQETRLEQISNNGIHLAIVDAKTMYESFKKKSDIRVLSLLWKNWLYIIGTVPSPFLSIESTNNFLIHENSIYFAKVWKEFSPNTKFKWFNEQSIPSFENGFSEEVLIFTGPSHLKEINYWLEKFAGIHLLSLEKRITEALILKNKWLLHHKLPSNSYQYQTEPLTGLVWNPVLITHRNFPKDIAKDLLNIIFSQKEKINPHILFKNLLIEDNIAFRKVYPYHTSARNMFRLK